MLLQSRNLAMLEDTNTGVGCPEVDSHGVVLTHLQVLRHCFESKKDDVTLEFVQPVNAQMGWRRRGGLRRSTWRPTCQQYIL